MSAGLRSSFASLLLGTENGYLPAQRLWFQFFSLLMAYADNQTKEPKSRFGKNEIGRKNDENENVLRNAKKDVQLYLLYYVAQGNTFQNNFSRFDFNASNKCANNFLSNSVPLGEVLELNDK